MNREEIENKWNADLKMWDKVYNENALFHTHEEKQKAICYASTIASLLADVKLYAESHEATIEALKKELEELTDSLEHERKLCQGYYVSVGNLENKMQELKLTHENLQSRISELEAGREWVSVEDKRPEKEIKNKP